MADTFARQIEYPTVIVLAAGDEPADATDSALLAARHFRVGDGTLAPALLAGFDLEAAAARQHPACALLPREGDEHGVTTLVWRRDRPFHPGRLHAALDDLTCAAARIRGRFWLAALPDAAWEMVPAQRRVAAALDWHPEHGDRCQHLTFTSPDLDELLDPIH